MPGAIGPDRVRSVTEPALTVPGVDGVEVLFIHEWVGLTRFATSAIHQSTWQEDTGVRVRVVKGGRIGVAASNDFSEDGARRAAESAREMAQVVAPDPLFPGLAPPQPVPQSDRFDEATASTTPDHRAEGVAALIAECGRGLVASGAFETGASEVAVLNSEGQFCWAPSTLASVTTVVTADDGGSGFAETFAPSLAQVDPVAVGRRAARKAAASRRPIDLEPGRYPVVLEPAAVSTLVGFLAWIGFGGRLLAEERSCFSGKQGQQVAQPAITIYDDATSPDTIGLPFDFEGTPRRRVDLIRDGVFIDGVYDRRTARQASTETTGHALPPPNPEGPFPLNLFMEPGKASVEDMIASTDRGLLVTRFHYSNVVHPLESTITGMTRDGTFLIEDGRISRPVRDVRFTDSVLRILAATEALTATQRLVAEADFYGRRFATGVVSPALRAHDFRITGATVAA
jgi:predicted Zn-dependent protease